MVKKYSWKVVLALCVIAILAMSQVLSCAAPPPTPPTPPPPPPVAKPTPDEQLAKLQAAAKQEGKLTLYGLAFTGDFGSKLEKYWSDKYGIKLSTSAVGSAAAAEKLIAENAMGKMVADIAAGTGWLMYPPLEKTSILKKLGVDLLPDLQKFAPTDKKVYPVSPLMWNNNMILNAFTPFSVFINTKLVPPADEPKSFKDLLNPKWKGKISISDSFIIGNIYFPYIVFGPDGTNELNADYWKALGDQIVEIADISDAQQRVASGEFAMCLEADTQTQLKLFQAGGPVKVLEMSEGTVALTGAGFAVVDKATNPNAALFFINWAISKEGSLFYADERPQIALRADITPTKPMAKEIVPLPYKKLVSYTDEQMNKLLKYKADKMLKKLWGKT